jgi:hypothetical protein
MDIDHLKKLVDAVAADCDDSAQGALEAYLREIDVPQGDVRSFGDVLAHNIRMRHEIDSLTIERDAYRDIVCDLLASAYPHPVEHPTMTKQWARAKALLLKYAVQPASTREG